MQSDSNTALTILDGDRALAETIVRDASRRYFDSRRKRVDAFIDQHFSFRGSARLHRHAVGWDILRAPANLFLAVPNIAIQLAAGGARLTGARGLAERLRARRILLETAVGREVEWLVMTEFLELPFQRHGRTSETDALAETVVADNRVTEALAETLEAIEPQRLNPAFRKKLEEGLLAYTETRPAASDIATTLVTVSTGAAAFHQLTPGTVSLSASLTAALAHHAAVASFPLGASLGSVWYSAFPAAISPLMVTGTALGLTAVAGFAAAFANMATDPLQRRLGFHRRRLLKLVDTLEQQFRAEDARFMARDHYVAKLLDLGDILTSVYRLTRS